MNLEFMAKLGWRLIADENIGQTQNVKEPFQMPIGPITRAMAKKFQKVLNRLMN